VIALLGEFTSPEEGIGVFAPLTKLRSYPVLRKRVVPAAMPGEMPSCERT